MKRFLFTSVSLVTLGLMSPALAADLPMYTKAPAVSPTFDWSGFYAGVYGGGGFGNHNLNNALGPAGFANFTINYDSTGAVAGGELGYQVQSGVIVGGVEVGGFWSDVNGSDLSQFNAGTLPIASVDQTKLKSGATLLARGGIAVDRLLLFFTGGWAYGQLQHTNTDPVFGVDQFDANRSGLAAGAGIAYAITNNLIGKFEYRYYDFGTYHRDAPTNGQSPYSVANTYSVVTVGLDYKFGGSVVAKY
ncbi:outer membrane beta-barrel protein [Bradyrhizobium jicamae]|uniref:Outer membrane beta-barrel protein n=1 Tax=Bradyrhizobium jicamae TaxID=280332 RepID=A0ABS5FWS9_9BRAD|nr:outer membrane beta-barrel protein [Bradyrhizobium jicamae]MBR0801269.1 outer membrane beta-barrel protein [Bradyrhizobium jicamae]